MNRKKITISIFIAVALTILFVIFFSDALRSKSAALLVESNVPASVYINGQQAGNTPYEGEFNSTEVTLRLVPSSIETTLTAYESKITLTPGVKTIVRRVLAESDELSGGEIISFDATSGDTASIAIVSTPDAAKVLIDRTNEGRAPTKITNVTPGTHDVDVDAEGYASRKFSINAVVGFTVTAIVELPIDQTEIDKANEKIEEIIEEATSLGQVVISDTPTGFLRVRSGPGVANGEIGRATPGDEYEILEIDAENGWIKIDFDGEEGWVSSTYAKKIEEPEP